MCGRRLDRGNWFGWRLARVVRRRVLGLGCRERGLGEVLRLVMEAGRVGVGRTEQGGVQCLGGDVFETEQAEGETGCFFMDSEFVLFRVGYG